jgi:hypothetical protein
MATLDQGSFEGFVSEARKRALEVVVLAWQEEWGQLPGRLPADAANPHQVAYERIMRSVVLGYQDGTILRLTVDGPAAERSTLRRRLEEAGFAVSERCRNLT